MIDLFRELLGCEGRSIECIQRSWLLFPCCVFADDSAMDFWQAHQVLGCKKSILEWFHERRVVPYETRIHKEIAWVQNINASKYSNCAFKRPSWNIYFLAKLIPGMASGRPEFSPCINSNNGSHTVTERFVAVPFNNGGSSKKRCLSTEHSIAWPTRDSSFKNFT